MNDRIVTRREKLLQKAFQAGEACAWNDQPLNGLHYFDLANSIDKNFDLVCQEAALRGFNFGKDERARKQIQLNLEGGK